MNAPTPRHRPARSHLRPAAWRVAALLGFAVQVAHATTPTAAADERDAAHFAAWRAAHDAEVAAFEAQLDAAGLRAVVPLHELLRSASAWRTCAAEPYAVPPAAQWPAVQRVLQLLQHLRAAGVLGTFEVVSAYRAEALNRCAGGAPGSAHLRSFAVDLLPRDATDPTPALCAFWREQGPQWAMGFSRYPSGRLHIDTLGWRTWGADHRSGTAVCSPP